VNRLRPYLDDLIGPLQSSFISSRSSADNAFVAQEVMHHMHHSKSKRGTLVAKINSGKVYDRVIRDFLQSILEDFSLTPGIASLIMLCMRSSSLTLLWNESKLHSFTPTCGLRQGDQFLLICLFFVWRNWHV
jgi:hypothetical protein